MDRDDVEKTVQCLSTGGVVLLPTDTVYGLAVVPFLEQSVGRVYTLKRRPRSLKLPIMVSSEAELKPLGFDINESARRLLRSPLIPGSLTLAMGFVSEVRPTWLKDREEAAMRIPDDEWLLAVLSKTGPLLVTSANVHGSDTPESMEGVLAQLEGQPDLSVDGGILRTISSTLVNCRLSPAVIERIGAVSEAEVMRYLK